MLSIQFHALGREGQIGAPPSVLLPPDLEPMPLDEALGTVRAGATDAKKRDAAWTLLRGTKHPPFGVPDTEFALRYPAALRYFCGTQDIDFPLDDFDVRRARFRSEARLFAAALVAFALGEGAAFQALRCAVEKRSGPQDDGLFAGALRDTRALGGKSAVDFLAFIDNPDTGASDDAESQRARCRESLCRLESDVGVSLETYIGEFADTVAFMESWEQTHGRREQDVTVYPAFTVAAQDPRTLTTVVTATSLVAADDFRQLRCAMDPRNWTRLSTTFRKVEYVEAARRNAPIGEPHGPALLHENVRIRAHEDRTDMGYFDNLLWVTFTSGRDAEGRPLNRADLSFSLHQSVRSRFLWDERPGGLLIDSGWTKLRSISTGLWRVTARKVLRFTDRTPQSSWDGPLDFGQTLNYLAPSTLSTWLESDIYGGEDPAVDAPVQNGGTNA